MLLPPPDATEPLSVSLTLARALRIFLILLATTPAWGALAIDQVKSTDRSSSSTSITSPSFSTTAANELLLAFISSDAKSAGVTVTAVNGGGLTWVLVRRTNAQLGTAEVWRAFAPTTLANATVVATVSQSVAASITVVTFTGTDTTGTNGSGAIGATASASASSGAPTASLVTTRNGSWVLGVGDDWDNGIARTVPSTQTMVHQYLATVGDTYWVQRQTAATPSSGTTVTINDTAPTGDRYNLAIVEVLPAAAGAVAVSISPASASLLTGGTQQFTATVSGSTNTGVTWSATGGSITTGGMYTAPSTAGSYTVTATSVADTTKSASAAITVTTTPVVSVTISPTSASILTNGTQQFAVTVTGTTNTAVTWSATGGTVTGGLYTAPATAGSYTVTATSAADSTKSASAKVTVTAPVAVSVSISPTSASLLTGGTQQFTATVTGTTNTAVTWTATGGTISTNGLYTASNTTGSYTVKATSVADTTKSASATVTVTVSSNANLTVDGSLTYQTIDGLGMNMNPDMWLNGQLEPALDLWTQTNGASLYRLTIECTDWVCPGCTLAQANAQIALLHNMDAATLASTYGTAKMNDLWNTIAYMNSKGVVGNQIVLNTQGWTATWMGGSGGFGSPSYINSGLEPQFATMWASLAYYGRKVKNLNFTIIDPLNEEDQNGIEGPTVGTGQTTTIFADLVSELAHMGLTDMTLTGPSTLTTGTTSSYTAALESNSTVAANLKHISFHSYTGSPATVPSGSYPADWWVGETNPSIDGGDTGTCPSGEWSWSAASGDNILADLNNGLNAVMVWGGYDSYEPQEASPVKLNCWWYMSYNATTGLFTPLNGFYVTASINHFIRPGAVRIRATDSVSGGSTIATYNAPVGQVSVVGHNTKSTSITINGQLKNVPLTVTSLLVYFTNSTTNFQSQGSIPVNTSGVFTLTVPADTFFSLSNVDPVASGSAANVIFYDNFAGTSLDTTKWQVITRHGEYAQSETECNVPSMVTVNNGLTITTEAQSASCGDYFNTPSSWPYITGDIQWPTLNFTYGTVSIYAKFPSSNTNLWPATWLLSSNCQYTNPLTGNTGVTIDGHYCPNVGSSGYYEIDMTECYNSGGWCQFNVANPSFSCGGRYAVDTNWHLFTTVWTAANVKQYMDGVLVGTCSSSNTPMFLIIQTQTGGVGGTPNSLDLPATLQVGYVKVTQP